MTVTATGIAGHCLGCGASLYEGGYTKVDFSDGEAPPWALYCKNKCEPIAEDESKEEARVTLSDVPMMVAKHYAALVPFVDRDLVYDLTRDYHTHLLSIATVGNPPEEPTESGDDGWISVKERLPSLNGNGVLVAYSQKGARVVSCAALYTSGDGATYWGEWDSQELFVVDGVTHWQPFPEPPKEPGEGAQL